MRVAGIGISRTARHARVLALLASLPLFASAALLTGCGSSFDGGLGGEFKEQQKTGSGLTTGSTTETASEAVPLPRSAEALTSVATPGNAAYKIGPQDVLDVSVFKVPDLTRSVQVADTGTINLPLLGEVPAAGKTARELERHLAKQLGAKYLQSPQVTVYVKEYNSQRVTVEGAVKTPGVHTLKGRTSLLQFIAMSGGLDAVSDSAVVVFRRTDGKRYAARFDIDEIRAGRAEDPTIMAGDVIVVSTSAMKSAWQDFLKALPVASAFRLFI
jgi:polysaccharide biosynthesis/export protein